MKKILDFFKKLVKGDFGLFKTYWGYFILVGVIYQFVPTFLFTLFEEFLFEMGYVISYGLLWTWVAYQTVVFIGIWNAATIYSKGLTKTQINRSLFKGGWGTVAKAFVIIGFISYIRFLQFLQ